MTVKEVQHLFHEKLTHLYPIEEIQQFFYLLAEHILQFQKIDIALNAEFKLNTNTVDYFLTAITDLEQEKPIQYIIGATEFYGLRFKVTKDVLIPRPETEELVDWIINEIKDKRQKTKDNPKSLNDNSRLSILDIGTGSGCIAISLAKNLPNTLVYALDISEEALAVAKQNAELNQVEIRFLRGDVLKTNDISSDNKESLQFDIIVSNPPYVRELEKQEIKNNVLENEPHLALFVKDDNPLLFYDKIATMAKESLKVNGHLYFEINQYLGKETSVLLTQKGFKNIELRKDLYSNDRMLRASYK